MLRPASRRSLLPIARAIFALTALTLGPIVASSCLTPEINYGPVDGLGGENGDVSHCENNRLDGDESSTDCGGSCKGCEIGQKCNVARDCAGPPLDDPAFVICDADNRCVLDCPRGKGDCNGRGDDGCEVDFLTDLEHCGACGAECDLAHAADQCMNGECLIKTDEANQGCDPNYANCNLNPEDGCEVNLLTDPKHCGSCEGAVCSAENGDASCKAGSCSINCDDGYDDCDKNAAANGCEIRTATNVNHCGGCGKVCEINGDDWSAFCVDGDCGQTQCPDNLGDCDGDGECKDELNTAEHCGRCGASCTVIHGTGECVVDDSDEATCAILRCESTNDANWADCDGEYTNGCEVDTQSTASRCGGCLPAEGGEGQDCSSLEGTNHVTVTACSDGGCTIVGCDSGWVDCDGNFANGCETNTSSDKDNCGGCANNGGDVCTAKPHVSTQCSSGSCSYTCANGWWDLNNDRYEDSGSDGCEAPAQVTLVGSSVTGSIDTGGNGNPLQINHTLQGVKGTQRLILVGVLCRANQKDDCALTEAKYGDTTLTLLDEVFSQNSSAKIYYALDNDLPAAGTYRVTLKRPNQEAGSIAAEVREFSGAEQSTFYAARGKSFDTNICSSSTTGPILSSLPTGSVAYVFGGGASPTNGGGSATATAPFTLSANRHENYIVYGSGYTAPTSGSVTATLDFSACNQSVIVAVGIRPEANY